MSSLRSDAATSGSSSNPGLRISADAVARTGGSVTPLGGGIKRVMDISGASVALVVIAPVMLLIALMVRLSSKGPAIFRHRRVGFGGQSFDCFKFRSMRMDADVALARLLESDEAARAEWEATHKLTRDPRITRVGAFLRRTSLDELPQLFNVLMGQMSLVGPRPIVSAEVPRYGAAYEVYASSRPGMTGLWQVSGRSDTDYDRRVALDVAYANGWSPWRDLAIAGRTVVVVLRGSGAR